MSKIKERNNEKTVGSRLCSCPKNKGITLMALIITIVLMLILASITVNVAINGGLFDYAKEAKDSTEIASEKEIVIQAGIIAEGNSKTGRITVEEMQKALNSITEKNTATAIETGDTITVKFNESNRCYEIDSKGNVEYIGKLKEKTLTVQCTDSTGKILDEKTYTILKDKYSITPPEVEGYESAVEKIEGEMDENKTINQLYYMIFDDDTTLVFTGLDESGNTTTDEASIVSYMVGDGTTTSGNGLLEKTVKGVLKIPETYNGKPVTQVGKYAFRTIGNVIKADTGDSVNKILGYAFLGSSITEFTIGKHVDSIESHTFWGCNSLKSITFKNSKATYGQEFHDCNAWTEIKLDDQNTAYKVEDNILYSADGKTLILCPKGKTGEVVVPDNVEVIEQYAFEICSQITKVTISDNVKTIKKAAFEFCKGMQELVIGKNVTSYGVNCFLYCINLNTVTYRNGKMCAEFGGCNSWTEIKINPENKNFKVEDNILYSYDGTKIYQCPVGREEEYITIDSVESIEDYAFYGCSKIKSIIIKENVKKIGIATFVNAGLEQIIIGKNVTSIGTRAFQNCSNLKTITLDSPTIEEKIITQTSCSYLVNVAETIYINEEITTIGSYITENYSVATSDKTGYVKYVKN